MNPPSITNISWLAINDERNGKAKSATYNDIRDPVWKYKHCNAMMWYDERINKDKHSKNPRFALCCGDGEIQLPLLEDPPQPLRQLLFGSKSTQAKNFQLNIRSYNLMFTFTSPDAKVDTSYNTGRGLPTFCIHGQEHHLIGSFLPMANNSPKFAELYIYDTENEISTIDKRLYNLSNTVEVVALIVGDEYTSNKRDIIIERQSRTFKRINELHPAYLSLQYPFLYPKGEDGYRPNILHKDHPNSHVAKRKKVTMHEYFCFKMQSRENEAQTILHSRRLKCNLRPDDCPDVVSRIFKMKLNHLMNDLKSGHAFGPIVGFVYTIEWQKKGFPHAHILILLHPSNKYPNPEDIDNIISTEIPNKDTHLELYELITKHMIHGPCGLPNMRAPCMVDGKYITFFPKNYQQATIVDQDGFPVYRTRNNGHTVQRNTHLNMEWCNQSTSSKYLFKYINKGSDQITTTIINVQNQDDTQTEVHDEIKHYLDCRYVSPLEACWKIFAFPMHACAPAVECMYFYLQDQEPEFIGALREANTWGSTHFLRKLCAKLLFMNTMDRRQYVWEQTWQWMADDIVFNHRRQGIQLSVKETKQLCLTEIENLLQGNRKRLRDFPSMSYPTGYAANMHGNKLIFNEITYDKELLHAEFNNFYHSLTDEHGAIFYKIMRVVASQSGGVYFLYGYGGNGKTFIWKTLSSAIWSNGGIVITVASSGIASLLLPGGRTTHFKFAIPVSTTQNSTCNIHQGNDLAELLKITQLIIWDEAPMCHKFSFEALDKSLKDIMHNDRPFGGKVIVFCGDFHQILPVVPRGNRSDIVHTSINASYIWDHYQILKLTTNMRLQTNVVDTNSDGKLGEPNDGYGEINIPDEFLIKDFNDPSKTIIETTYANLLQNYTNGDFLQKRVVLASTKDVVDSINDYVMSLISNEEKEYCSADKSDQLLNLAFGVLTLEFLNSLKISRIPNHKLKIKVGTPIILLRNLYQADELYNGTMLIVTRLGRHVVALSRVQSKKGLHILIHDKEGTPKNTTINVIYKEVFANL
ncbi:hypothetical protein AAZX31_09G086000 [Glycine max]